MRGVGVVLVVLAWAAAAGAVDCDLNGVDDGTEIAASTATDCNANGVPDACDAFPVSFAQSRVSAGSSPGAIAVGELTGDRYLDIAVANTDAGTITILAGGAGATFTSMGTVTVGTGPEAVVAAAMGSGAVITLGASTDLVVANGGSNTLSLMKNNGDGTFTAAAGSPFTIGGHPNGLAVGDLTGEGDPDVVVTRRDMGDVVPLANDGSGSLMAPGGPVATGAGPRAVVLGDLSGDGRLDALVANEGAGTVSYLRNNAGVAFFAAVTVATVGDPVALALGDVDGEADLDFAVLSGTDGAVHVFLNDGTGSFTAGSVVPVASGGAALQLVDVDGNGTPDIVAVTSSGNAVAVALNDGTGAFAPSAGFAVGTTPRDVAPLDVDVDGRLDLVVSNTASTDVSVLHAGDPVARDCDANGVLDACEPAGPDCNANGVRDTCDAASPIAFGAPVATTLAGSDAPLAVGDVDGDGRADVVLRSTGPKLVVARAASDRSVAQAFAANLPDTPSRLLLVDVDADGLRDLVATSDSGMAVYVLRNGGGGAIADTHAYSLTTQPMAVVAGEFTGDAQLDLVVANSDVDSLRVLPGTGGGNFAVGATIALAAHVVELVAGDVDHDGDADLVVLEIAAGPTTQLQVVRNDAGTLVVEPPVLVQTPPSFLVGMAGADLDGDGDLDLLLVQGNSATGTMRLLRVANGGGTFTIAQALPLAQVPASALLFLRGVAASPAMADLDGDGHLDAVLPLLGGTAAIVFRNHGDGSLELGRGFPLGRRISSLAAGDVDGDGAPDLVAAASASDDSVVVLPGLARPPVDVNANGVPDCREETRCGDCADDEGDGLIDVADPDCGGAVLTLRQVAVRPSHGRRPSRAKLVADVPASLTLDPAATSFGVSVQASAVYCGTPALRQKGKHTVRLSASSGALTALTVQTLRHDKGLRARATLQPVDPAPASGDVVRVWLVGGGRAFHGEAALHRKGKVLAGP